MQPKVARNELPWGLAHFEFFNPEGVESIEWPMHLASTPSGLRKLFVRAPKVARSSQTWAD